MADIKNLLKSLAFWTKSDADGTTEITDTFTLSADGLTATYVITKEGSYIYNNIDTADIKGHVLKLSLDNFKSSDGEAWLQVRFYNADVTDYTDASYKQLDGDFLPDTPFTVEVEVPGDCGRLRICARHEYASEGIDPPATITISNPVLVDTYTESLTALNFHKVLDSALPESVTPGSEHIYFTTDGTTVKQYISTREGMLIPVGSGGGSGGTATEEYDNAYTRLHIKEREAEVAEILREGNNIVFVITTDTHVRIEDGDAGRYNQIRDVVALCKAFPVDYICDCGDIMSYCQDIDGLFEPRIEEYKNIVSKARCPFFSTRGNHDYNTDDYNPGNNPNILEFDEASADRLYITNDIWNRSITSQINVPAHLKVVFDEKNPMGGYYYVDDTIKKHRMIFVNSEETHEEDNKPYRDSADNLDYAISGIKTKLQVEWIVDKALDMTGKTDYLVSFYSHVVPYTDRAEEDSSEFHGYGGDNPEMRKIVKAFKLGTSVELTYGVIDTEDHEWKNIPISKDFSEQGMIGVIGWFGGHIHDDCYRAVDLVNIFVSTCICASRRDSWSYDENPVKLPPDRNNTDLAMSTNMVFVNKDTRSVKVIKFGSKRDNTDKTSSDYEWSFWPAK